MASFRIHLTGATIVSGAAATTVATIGLVEPQQTLALFSLGIGGGLLPDIDADNSTPVRLTFSLLGLIGAFLAVFYALGRYHFSIAELFLLGTATFGVVRFCVFECFLRLTEHRGVFHSLLAVTLFTLTTTSVSHHWAHSSAKLAWLHGLFMGLGYLFHLILDEVFSVDVNNARLKRSFGTALKPFGRDIKTTLVAGLLTLGIWTTLPDPSALQHLLSRERLVEPIKRQLWPGRSWFAALQIPYRPGDMEKIARP